MPFDDDEQEQQPKVGLKKNNQKSIFDSMQKKPSKEDFDNNVKVLQEKSSQYKERTADLAIKFSKTVADKTLQQNKNLFQTELENDLLRNMVKLAQEINSDDSEREGEGSLSWITLLLKTCFNQRDKINKLEYNLTQLNKKIDAALDNSNKNE